MIIIHSRLSLRNLLIVFDNIILQALVNLLFASNPLNQAKPKMSVSNEMKSLLLMICMPIAVLALSTRIKRSRQSVSLVENSNSVPKTTPRSRINSTSVADEDDVFEVSVSPSDRFKFNAAHFIAYKGFRERLHGHNYSVTVTMIGRSMLREDGYLIDFGEIKRVVGGLCKDLNEHFILPMNSDALQIETDNVECRLTCEDGTRFVMPITDVAKLPIVHSSAEEIARYMWTRIIEAFGRDELIRRGIVTLEVSCAEMPHQQATFRRRIRDSSAFVMDMNIPPPLKGCCGNGDPHHSH